MFTSAGCTTSTLLYHYYSIIITPCPILDPEFFKDQYWTSPHAHTHLQFASLPCLLSPATCWVLDSDEWSCPRAWDPTLPVTVKQSRGIQIPHRVSWLTGHQQMWLPYPFLSNTCYTQCSLQPGRRRPSLRLPGSVMPTLRSPVFLLSVPFLRALRLCSGAASVLFSRVQPKHDRVSLCISSAH